MMLFYEGVCLKLRFGAWVGPVGFQDDCRVYTHMLYLKVTAIMIFFMLLALSNIGR